MKLTAGASLAACLALSLALTGTAEGRQKRFIHKSPPDLTKGGKPDDTHDWRLGPIGANGWVFNRRTRAVGSLVCERATRRSALSRRA